MTRRIWTALVSILLLAALVAGCGTAPAKDSAANKQPPVQQPQPQVKSTPKQTTYPVTIKDGAGRDVTIPAEPKRIVSVAPANTELVFALGKQGALVGRSDFDDYPAAVKDVPSIGGFFPPNYEKIVAAKPDLLLMVGGSEPERKKLTEEFKINVLVVEQKNFDDLYSIIKTLGVALNAQENAEKIVTDMQKSVADVKDKVAKATSKPKVYFEVWDDPLQTVGKGTFINDLIVLAGGENIAGDVDGWAMYKAELVAAKNPDFILSSSKDIAAKVKARKGWDAFTAVQKNQVVAVADQNIVVRPGPRLVEGLKWFAQTLHPELFK